MRIENWELGIVNGGGGVTKCFDVMIGFVGGVVTMLVIVFLLVLVIMLVSVFEIFFFMVVVMIAMLIPWMTMMCLAVPMIMLMAMTMMMMHVSRSKIGPAVETHALAVDQHVGHGSHIVDAVQGRGGMDNFEQIEQGQADALFTRQ